MKKITATARTVKEAMEAHATTIREALEVAERGEHFDIVCYEPSGMDIDGAGLDVIALGDKRYNVKTYTTTQDSDPNNTDLDGVLRAYEGMMDAIEEFAINLEENY